MPDMPPFPARFKSLDEWLEFLRDNEVYFPRYVEPWGWCGIRPMLYTIGVIVAVDEYGQRGRFCFGSLQDAHAFLQEWDGKTRPIPGVDGCKADKLF